MHNWERLQKSIIYFSGRTNLPNWSWGRHSLSARKPTVAHQILCNAENGTNISWPRNHHLQGCTTQQRLSSLQGFALKRQQLQLQVWRHHFQGWRHTIQGFISHPRRVTHRRTSGLKLFPNVHVPITPHCTQFPLNPSHDSFAHTQVNSSPLSEDQAAITCANFFSTGQCRYSMKKQNSTLNTDNFGNTPSTKTFGINSTPTNWANFSKAQAKEPMGHTINDPGGRTHLKLFATMISLLIGRN